jgi:cytochrome c oxidase subunit 2
MRASAGSIGADAAPPEPAPPGSRGPPRGRCGAGGAATELPLPWIESAALRPHDDDVKRSRRPLYTLSLAVTVSVIGSLLLAPEALANFITPKSGGSPNANEIDSLYKIILYIAAVVFVIVEGALLYSVIKFRAKKGAVAAQIHGNTRLEIGWTVGAALILVVLTVVTFVKLPGIINPPNSDAGAVLSASTSTPNPPNGKKFTICVQGRQYIWRYTYGNDCLNNSFNGAKTLPYSYTTMEAPQGVTVVLDIQANDVIHSWWIPSLGGKVDAVPGYTTYTWFKALHTGTFHGQCAQLCGRQHAAMVAYVHVVPPQQFQAWLAQQQQQINAANDQVTKLRSYLTQTGNLGQ